MALYSRQALSANPKRTKQRTYDLHTQHPNYSVSENAVIFISQDCKLSVFLLKTELLLQIIIDLGISRVSASRAALKYFLATSSLGSRLYIIIYFCRVCRNSLGKSGMDIIWVLAPWPHIQIKKKKKPHPHPAIAQPKDAGRHICATTGHDNILG